MYCFPFSLPQTLLYTYNWDDQKIKELDISSHQQLFGNSLHISNGNYPLSGLSNGVSIHNSSSSNGNNSNKEKAINSTSANCDVMGYNYNYCPSFGDESHQQSQNIHLFNNSVKCRICLNTYSAEKCTALGCGHNFCKQCWSSYMDIQISSGVTIGIQCMERDCTALAGEQFTLDILAAYKPGLLDKYRQFVLMGFVKSNPSLRFCPGPDCRMVIHSKENKAKRVVCSSCGCSFCYRCGIEYHAPTDCNVIKKWLTKCADDSETANYISAHTKDCPKCHICIEKNGGCNHMQCYSCKHEFCWICLGDWKTHGSDYYECSKYKENPNIVCESIHAQAREALKKYLFYFERWDNHARSLRLEKQALEQIKERIHEKVMSNKGTWIDWQYLVDAAALLAKCRYTLQYTYPYAYYMDSGSRKMLFEYQQAQLEAEIENLSWKVERAETWDRGDLENQMDIAEKRRATLLKDFFAD